MMSSAFACQVKGLGSSVSVLDPGRDRLDEGADAGEDAATQSPVGQLLEPAFDQVEPGAGGRGEVQVPAGSAWVGQPGGHLGCGVGGQVVQHHVDVQVTAGRVLSMSLKNASTSAPVCRWRQSAITSPGGDVEGGEQVGGAVALVVVGHRPGPTAHHRQARLGPVQAPAPGSSRRSRTPPPSPADPGRGRPRRPAWPRSRGSVDSLKVSTFHGCSSWSRQMFATAPWLTPIRLARVRLDQCVDPSAGFSVSVTRTTCSTIPSGSHGLRPRPSATTPTPDTPR